MCFLLEITIILLLLFETNLRHLLWFGSIHRLDSFEHKHIHENWSHLKCRIRFQSHTRKLPIIRIHSNCRCPIRPIEGAIYRLPNRQIPFIRVIMYVIPKRHTIALFCCVIWGTVNQCLIARSTFRRRVRKQDVTFNLKQIMIQKKSTNKDARFTLWIVVLYN